MCHFLVCFRASPPSLSAGGTSLGSRLYTRIWTLFAWRQHADKAESLSGEPAGKWCNSWDEDWLTAHMCSESTLSIQHSRLKSLFTTTSGWFPFESCEVQPWQACQSKLHNPEHTSRMTSRASFIWSQPSHSVKNVKKTMPWINK